MELIIANLPAMFFGAIAAVLSYCDVSGWGWFLVPAILLIHGR